MKRITIIDGTYAEAVKAAIAAATVTVDGVALDPGPILRVTTRRTRIIRMPEKVTTKQGDRDFGKERRHPKTVGWRLRRTFTFA